MSGSYRRPQNLETALDLLASAPMTVAAGCTDLFPATERKILPGDILDVTGIDTLRGITWEDDHLRIGAATTWSEIRRADLPPALRTLQLAACEVGALQIQNRGTIGGNLCNASPAADGVPPLLVCDAQIELRSVAQTRHLPLAEFLAGPRKTRREPDELLTAILLPKASLAGGSHFLKLGARSYLVISIVMTAARLVIEDGLVVDATLAVGACGPVATRLAAVEQVMIGKPLSTTALRDELVAAALSPIGDIRADAGYRAAGAAELLRRTVAALDPSARAAA